MKELPLLLLVLSWCGCSSASAKGQPDMAGSVAGPTLSDSFDGAALDPSWSVLHRESVDISVAASALTLTLTQPALWFDASEGVLVYKQVSGDFKVSATVHARRASAPTLPPPPPVHLGGLMARALSSTSENYVFIVVGHDANGVSVETKSTLASSSQYAGVAWPSGDAELRLCRVGADFSLWKRPPGAASWTMAQSFSRPDLPMTLQVGPNIYSSARMPDVQVSFDEVSFAAVSGAADCAID